MVDGTERGKVVNICADSKCQTHHNNHASGRYQASPEEKARRRAELKRQRVDQATKEKVLDGILAKVQKDGIDRDTLRIVAQEFSSRLWHELRKKLVPRCGLAPVKLQYGQDFETPLKKYLKTCDDKMLDRVLVEMTVAADVWNPPGIGSRAEGPLMALAKHHGVNAKKIEAEIKAQFGQEKAAQKPKKATTETGNYDKCSLRKRMASNAKGVKIPKGSGKCTREGGLCVAKMKGGKKE